MWRSQKGLSKGPYYYLTFKLSYTEYFFLFTSDLLWVRIGSSQIELQPFWQSGYAFWSGTKKQNNCPMCGACEDCTNYKPFRPVLSRNVRWTDRAIRETDVKQTTQASCSLVVISGYSLYVILSPTNI